MDEQKAETTQPAAAPPAAAPKSKTGTVFLSILALLLLAGGVGVYLWQHHKVNTLTAQVASLQKQFAAQTTKIASLEKQATQTTQAAQPDLKITVNNSTRF